MNYEELVKALRYTAESISRGQLEVLRANVLADAAAAIEALQAQLPKRGEIVRCRECKHYIAGFECIAEGDGIERDPDWFCADGERKEAEA